MQLKFKNEELAPAITFLQGLELEAPGPSRHRSKVVNMLLTAARTYDDDTNALLATYANKDDKGNPVINGTKYDVPDGKMHELGIERTKLNEEEIVIDGGMYASSLEAFPEVLAHIDTKLSGKEAAIYDNIMTQLEEQQGKTEE